MSQHIEDGDRLLDRVIAEIRDELPEQAVERAVLQRVSARLAHEVRDAAERDAADSRIRDCSGFQALIADYHEGRLAGARRLLLEDHLGECVTCRRALRQARVGAAPRTAVRAESGRVARWGWRIAAAAIFIVGMFGLSVRTDVFSFSTGGLIRVEALEGQAFRVSEGATVPVSVGDSFTLRSGETLRTAKGASAVLKLDDASQIEVRERSELAVKNRHSLVPGRRADGVIELERGSIIVEASDQGSGHLYVDTDECRVAVTGTVFSVNHGMRGSRVSVIEGEVRVSQSSDLNVLRPGDQLTTRAALERVPVENEIAWSQNVDRYRQLLREMRALGREMDDVLSPDLRYSTALLDIVPADTTVYVAIPNLADGVDEAYRILEQRVAASDVLREWWQAGVARSGAEDDLRRAIDRLRAWGDQFGDEIVIAISANRPDEHDVQAPLILARLTHPDGFARFLEAELADAAANGTRPPVTLFEGPRPPPGAPTNENGLYLWRRGDLLVLSPSSGRLAAFADELATTGGLAGAGSRFHARLAEMYGGGAEWLIGGDIGRLVRSAPDAPGEASLAENMGLLDVEHLLVEHRRRDGKFENRAVLTFDKPRRGVAAWLSPSAPMGALDFVTPDASFAAGFVVKDLGLVVDELFGFIGKSCEGFERHLAEFEAESGINVREDIARPLGGEFALALDGPILPVPAWKLVVEVYDPQRFERAVEWAVEQLDRRATAAGARGFRLERHRVGEREYVHIRSLDAGLGAHYVIEDGYLIAAASRTLIDRALSGRALGIGLPGSPRFRALLPADGEVNFSGVVYQNLGPVLAPLTGRFAEALGRLGPDQQQLVEAAATETVPSLGLLYGEQDRIVFVNRSDGGLLTSSLGSLLSLRGLLDVQESLFQVVGDRSPEAHEASPTE